MITRIDFKKCNGCGICVDLCPLDALRMNEAGEKATIRYPEDCMTCYTCELNCPTGAIFVHPYKEVVTRSI